MTLPIANQTWLIAAGSSGVNALSSAEFAQVTVWSSTTAYAVGAVVTGPDALQYQAVAASTNVAPPAAGTWVRSAYGSPDRGLLAASAVPVPFTPAWDAATVFAPGASVVFGGNLFVTAAGSVGVAPPAGVGHNVAWEFVGSAQSGFAASFYVAGGGSYTSTVYAGIEWYDAGGALIAVPSGLSPAGVAVGLPVYQRFASPLGEVGGTAGNTLGLVWTANPVGFWQVSASELFKNPVWTGAQKIKLLYVADGRADCCVGVTFTSGVADSTVEDTGLVVRLSDTSNYWLFSRSKVQKMVAGVLSLVAGFPRLPIGTRAYVQAVGSTLKFYKYPGGSAAPVLVATITDSFNATATRHGLYDQVF